MKFKSLEVSINAFKTFNAREIEISPGLSYLINYIYLNLSFNHFLLWNYRSYIYFTHILESIVSKSIPNQWMKKLKCERICPVYNKNKEQYILACLVPLWSARQLPHVPS